MGSFKSTPNDNGLDKPMPLPTASVSIYYIINRLSPQYCYTFYIEVESEQ